MVKLKYEIYSDIREADVETTISTFLGFVTPSGSDSYVLNTVDENLTGADKSTNWNGALIYLQFKASKGMKSLKDVPNRNWKPRGRAYDVRKMREEYELDCDPILYFELRKKAKLATDFQHNILLSHHSPADHQFASYVAPLFLDKGIYRSSLIDANYRDAQLFIERYDRPPISRRHFYLPSSISQTFFLRSHVSIKPHVRVDKHEHYYSYSSCGGDIAWHSEIELIARSPSTLFSFFSQIARDGKNSSQEISLEVLAKRIRSQAEVNGTKIPDSVLGKSTEVISWYGKHLREEWGINQFLLLTRR